MKIYFLTYGDSKYNISKKHLSGLAKYSNFFDEVISLGPKNLDNKFKLEYSQILDQDRGSGYWIWKYKIIQSLLNEIKDGDIIVYCDAGASLNYYAKKRFTEYIELLNDSNFSSLRMKCEEQFKEKQFTTKELFNYFNIGIESDIATSTQLQAGHMFFKKNKDSLNYFMEYEELLKKDRKLITDYYSSFEQTAEFIENRHDQSIFSLMSKKFGAEIIKNETEFRLRPAEQFDYPFLSVRVGGHGIKDKVKFYLFYNSKIKTPIFFPQE